ncbi:MAG: YigZ family protein [Paludibacteraceae bacterium]|nr:YigZ family protein [Paludibacteraceae bacterium]
MQETITTISTPSNGLYKDKGSRFLSFAEPVDSVEQIKQRLDYYRHKYFDARHVCYAYMLGAERVNFRANDDGEPSGTAGRPILGQINSKQLTNVMVVVVRYFWGILLGTSGLIVAYREATKDALCNADIITKDLTRTITLRFPYEKMSEKMKLVRDTDSRILKEDFDGQCILTIEYKVKHEHRFQ